MKYHNHTLQTNPEHREVEHYIRKTIKVKQAALSAIPIKIIAKLERIQHKKTRTKFRTPQTMGATLNQQQKNHCRRMDSTLSH